MGYVKKKLIEEMQKNKSPSIRKCKNCEPNCKSNKEVHKTWFKEENPYYHPVETMKGIDISKKCQGCKCENPEPELPTLKVNTKEERLIRDTFIEMTKDDSNEA